jgi:hypothetical protein
VTGQPRLIAAAHPRVPLAELILAGQKIAEKLIGEGSAAAAR